MGITWGLLLLVVQHIHHDANENNVIVDQDKQEVVALIDW